MDTEELRAVLALLTDKESRTTAVHQWLKDAHDDIKSQYAINWRIPHTLFNVTCKHIPHTEIQNIDWYEIYKSRDMGNWSHGGKVSCLSSA